MPTIANITVSTVPEKSFVKIINISGELDESNLPDLEGVVNPLVQDANNKILIFHLDGLEFMSSKIIGYFASTYTTLGRDQRKIIFTDFDENIKDILALVGLDQLITTYPTLDEAIQVINSQLPISQSPINESPVNEFPVSNNQPTIK